MLTVGDRIKLLRESKDMTQAELAKKMGLKDRSSVTKFEKAGNDISLYTIEKASTALDCSVAYLMGFEDKKIDYTEKYDDLDIEMLSNIKNRESLYALMYAAILAKDEDLDFAREYLERMKDRV